MQHAPRPQPQDGQVALRPRTDDEWLFDVEAGGSTVGSAALRLLDGRDATGAVRCEIDAEHQGSGYAHRALRLLISYAFDEAGLRRVEAYIDPTDAHARRLASRAGLRKEGIVRGYRADGDALLVARTAEDPDPTTREAFRAGLNAGLPRKRAIAQGLIRDDAGRVLMCELVYKRYWDLPGGVVDPNESPARTVTREIREELNVDATAQRLAVVSWLPPWEGWDDAVLFAFEATVPAAQWSDSTLEPREIKALHWCDDAALEQHAAPYTARLVRRAIEQLDADLGPAYLEDGREPAR